MYNRRVLRCYMLIVEFYTSLLFWCLLEKRTILFYWNGILLVSLDALLLHLLHSMFRSDKFHKSSTKPCVTEPLMSWTNYGHSRKTACFCINKSAGRKPTQQPHCFIILLSHTMFVCVDLYAKACFLYIPSPRNAYQPIFVENKGTLSFRIFFIELLRSFQILPL